MKKVKVRCWKTGPKGELFMTYPEGHMGHGLICCTSCGAIYAVCVAAQLYIEPNLDKQLKGVPCLDCSSTLEENWSEYPETYMGSDGELCEFERSRIIPDDRDSVLVEFPEVYSK